jgi:subtilisin family serine protease
LLAVNPGQFRAREVLVLLRPSAPGAQAANALAAAVARDYGLQVEITYPSRLLASALVRYRIPDARSVQAVTATLGNDQRVRSPQPNFIYQLSQSTSATPGSLPQYALDVIGARKAQATSLGRNVTVAVIDTGIDDSHPDLAGALRDHFDAVGDGHWDAGQHGTEIGSLIAARGQLLGVAPGARLLSIRAFPAKGDQSGEATSLALVRALDWAVGQHASIVNMSLAGPEDPMVDAAVMEAVAAGTTIVAAAGNAGPGAPPAYPAALKGVIAVTATDQDDKLYEKANQGAYISVAAPGVDVLAAAPGSGYELTTGTSIASAEVSGIVALLKQLAPTLTPGQVASVLSRTAKSIAGGKGPVRVDAAKAVAELPPVVQAAQ